MLCKTIKKKSSFKLREKTPTAFPFKLTQKAPVFFNFCNFELLLHVNTINTPSQFKDPVLLSTQLVIVIIFTFYLGNVLILKKKDSVVLR